LAGKAAIIFGINYAGRIGRAVAKHLIQNFVLPEFVFIERGSGVMDFPHLTAPCDLQARVRP
jgi:hypothetical protein